MRYNDSHFGGNWHTFWDYKIHTLDHILMMQKQNVYEKHKEGGKDQVVDKKKKGSPMI